MLVKNKKHFLLGLGMTVCFLAVLVVMFSPVFGGKNAFEASDGLFNSISKASTDHFDELGAMVARLEDKDAGQTLVLPEAAGVLLAGMIRIAGAEGTYENGSLIVSGSLNRILDRIVSDSWAMFANRGDVLESAYGVSARQAAHAWWIYSNASSKAFKLEKRFDSSKVLDEVRAKAVEVGYNYYGVEPTPVIERIGVTMFALVFYVVYTMWWGFSIFFLCEGVGFVMKKSAKKEA